MLRKTGREFSGDQCTDLVAALTYYLVLVLSLFPALVVMVSLLGVFVQGQRTTDAVLQLVGELEPRTQSHCRNVQLGVAADTSAVTHPTWPNTFRHSGSGVPPRRLAHRPANVSGHHDIKAMRH